MKKALAIIVLMWASAMAAQVTNRLPSGGLAASCNAITAATSINPGLAGGCDAEALVTSGGVLPSMYTWQVITTGTPASIAVNFMGSLDGVTWTQLDTTTSATTKTVGPFAYKFLGCVPATLSGGSSPTITCQVSVGSGTAGTGTVNNSAGAGNAYYAAAGSAVTADTLIVDSGTGNLAFGAATPTLSTSATNAPLTLSPNGTGGVIFNDGLLATPAIVFASDTTTGFSDNSTVNHTVIFSANGASNLQFDSLGVRESVNGVLRFSATTVGTAANVGISSGGAGIIDVGAGTAADTTGKLKAAGYISVGTTATSNAGCGEGALVGGATAGKFTTAGSTSCTTIITMGNTATAPNGWDCHVVDLTTAADFANPHISSSNATTATIVSGTIVAADVISFSCIGY